MKANRFFATGAKVLLVIVALGVISGGCGGSAVQVEVQRVGPRAIAQTVMVAGSIQSTNPTQVIPQVYGPVAQVYVSDGQQVVAGQPILQLDTSSLEQQLLSAQASMESMESLAGMFNSLSSAASGIGSSVNSALATVDAGVAGLYDLEKMVVPALPADQRLAALQAIDAGYRAYQARIANRPSVSTGGGGGMSTGAQEAAASKSIENAEKNLTAATVVAPVSGTLVSAQGGGSSVNSLMSTLMSSFSSMIPSGLNLSSLTGLSGGMSNLGMPSGGPVVPGVFVSPGTPIYSIVDLKNMSMTAKVDEADIAKIAQNQTATVMLEAYPGKKFTGSVVRVADTATTNEAGATAFDVVLRMDTSDINLKIGMTGTADVTVATKQSATVVPVEAIVEKKGKKYVFKIVDGKARLTEVTVGLVTENSVEIINGVKIGDKVVVKGVEKLKDGQGIKQ
ncbi:MAG: efflux RND transporter periplasmic adaptor subunit [Candidatus Geothermincolia bacterium]